MDTQKIQEMTGHAIHTVVEGILLRLAQIAVSETNTA